MRIISVCTACIIVLLVISCKDQNPDNRYYHAGLPDVEHVEIKFTPAIRSIANIPLPEGYDRVALPARSFGRWLRKMPLKKDNSVFLYNKQLKANQRQHFAVLDISTGDKDLQQCADALMRLRAEYFFSINEFDQINFVTGNGTQLSFKEFALGERYALRGQRLAKYHAYTDLSCYTHACLMQFLNWVFSYCGTYSLALQSKPVQSFKEMQLGDMLVKAGAPGHAMMVGDVAIHNKTGKKIYLLIQSFMPAQDMHIVKNLHKPELGPWYEADADQLIMTPGFTFYASQLRRWE